MHLGALLIIAVCLSLIGTLFNLPNDVARAAPARPDIVMFYIDDFAAYPQRLWNDPDRTPALARFANKGVEFENAIASTPLCGPARANLLTGKYGHRSRVTQNDIRPYDQTNTLAPKLGRKGYETVFVGKHINRLDLVYPTRSKMARLSSAWDHFDVIWRSQGAFYDWRQYRKAGNRYFGSADTDHSSYQASKRAVQHIKATPGGKPLFMVISLFDGHAPMTPLRRFENHPSCRGVGGWAGPAYDEADVSDKPAYMRAQPRLGASAYDLQARCGQLLTVDWVIANVRQALIDKGRNHDTLQILTADNGWLMGDHRIFGKTTPYSVQVPLYMRWPKGMGTTKRRVEEPVSNVDFGRTFCALAGCTMKQSDGKSLLPLMKGGRGRLDRKFLYAEMLHNGSSYGKSPGARPAWSGVVSTRKYSDTRWVYTRYRTGEEELYDVSADPHQLRNLAAKPGHAGVLADMRRFQRQVWNRDGVKWKAKLGSWPG